MFLEIELPAILSSEVAAATPFRILTLLIFAAAVIHTLMANHFTSLAKKVDSAHARKERGRKGPKKVSFFAETLYFLGEVEIIFALWVVPLVIVITSFYGWDDVIQYLNSRIYVEPFFIVVVMSLASTRPIIKMAEKGMKAVANLFGGSTKAWWLALLTIGPILGSLITEAAAMTITALLFKEKLFEQSPSKRLAYATLGVMFVHFSVGGLLTNFAAPPALTLSRCWNWELSDFFSQFGMRVIIGILIVNALYFFFLRKDFDHLKPARGEKVNEEPHGAIPFWVTAVHLVLLVWIVMMAHYPPVFLGSYLLFLGFHQATRHHQYALNLKRPLMVGLFLAGLVIHGGFQGWWIKPLLGDLGFGAMMLSGTILTAFNENTTVAYLACFLDDLSPRLQYALVSGLVAGGGLTIIAHAPNPIGRALLQPYFKKGISPWNLFLGALIPTLIFLSIFYFFPAIKGIS